MVHRETRAEEEDADTADERGDVTHVGVAVWVEWVGGTTGGADAEEEDCLVEGVREGVDGFGEEGVRTGDEESG